MPHRQVFQSRTIGQSFIALKAEPCQSAGLGSTALLEYIGLLGGDAAHIICGIRVARHACQGIGITYTCTSRGKDILMRTAVTARFGERRLLIDDIQGISLIPRVGEVIVTGKTGIEIRHFHKCADIDMEVGITVVPGTVFVQAGETGKP